MEAFPTCPVPAAGGSVRLLRRPQPNRAMVSSISATRAAPLSAGHRPPLNFFILAGSRASLVSRLSLFLPFCRFLPAAVAVVSQTSWLNHTRTRGAEPLVLSWRTRSIRVQNGTLDPGLLLPCSSLTCSNVKSSHSL